MNDNKEKFNQIKYQIEYNKHHYSTFKVDLKKEELKKLNKTLKNLNLTKAEFLRQAIEELYKKNNIN